MTRKQPVAAYDPQLLAAIIRGSTERVEIRDDDSKVVISLAYELNALKRQIIREGHPAAEAAQRAKVGTYLDDGTPYVPHPVTRKLPPGRPKLVIIQPLGSRFRVQLTRAGVPAEPPPGATTPLGPGEPDGSPAGPEDELSTILGEPNNGRKET